MHIPAAQKGMENAAAATLPAARAEAVHKPMPTFQVAAKPAMPRRSRDTKEAGGMSILILPLLSLTLDWAPGGWSPSLQHEHLRQAAGNINKRPMETS